MSISSKDVTPQYAAWALGKMVHVCDHGPQYLRAGCCSCCRNAERLRRLNMSTLQNSQSHHYSDCEDTECRPWCWQTFK